MSAMGRTTNGSYEGATNLNVVWPTDLPNATDHLIQGYGGADTLNGNALDNYIFGDQRGDRSDFDATADGADVLYGFGGNDLLNPGAGSGNFVDGGTGTNTLDYRDATAGQAVTIDIDAGTATAGSYGSTTFVNIQNVLGSLNGENDIRGDDEVNVIYGGAFDDYLRGEGGADEMHGLGGKDIMRGGKGADLMRGGDGNDVVLGLGGKDRLYGGNNADKVDGGFNDDVLFGEGGKDKLFGRSGDDKLYGNAGHDTLIPGEGSDKLKGGNGRDTFVFFASSDRNTITDFTSGEDTIRIGSGASKFSQLKFTDTAAGLRVEFSDVTVFLTGLDRPDVSSSDFVFG